MNTIFASHFSYCLFALSFFFSNCLLFSVLRITDAFLVSHSLGRLHRHCQYHNRRSPPAPVSVVLCPCDRALGGTCGLNPPVTLFLHTQTPEKKTQKAGTQKTINIYLLFFDFAAIPSLVVSNSFFAEQRKVRLWEHTGTDTHTHTHTTHTG